MSAATGEYGSAARPTPYQPAERRTFTETKLGFKTSEFMMAVAAIVAILIATYADGDDTLTQNDGWRYAAWVAVAYIVSRGLAKLGVREPYTDDDR
jgi:hypothetical protein